jgi:molybdate transport system permease protein
MALEVQIVKQLPEFMLDVSFRAEGNSPLSILGPSGSGKTMLLRCIAGLERPDSGRVVLDDRVLLDTEQKLRVPARLRRLGLLFQHYALFPHRTVFENIEFGVKHLAPADREKLVIDAMRRTHTAGLDQRYPRELSGGEQQRVALARALVVEPAALLLDEPLSALDAHLRNQVEGQLHETFSEYRRPTLLVTHNVEEAYRLCAQLLVLSRGHVAALGPKEEIFRHPPNLQVARLTGCRNFSKVNGISESEVEALEWGCRLHVANGRERPAHIGIRAHHVDFAEAALPGASTENTFPCWLVRSSETPFRITLFLKLHEPPCGDSPDFHLQAEVFKEKWERFREEPMPWHVRLSPTSLFLMPD